VPAAQTADALRRSARTIIAVVAQGKTLAVILHYNTVECTDPLYRQLKPHEAGDYDLIVLDNGSAARGLSRYATHRLPRNVYFGGGLNAAIAMVLECPRYDSLLFLNSDLEIQVDGFVRRLREQMFADDLLMIVSPAVERPSTMTTEWRMMENWGASALRLVEWVDLPCPLFRRSFLEVVGSFDAELEFGWGQDFLSGMICSEHGWRIGVYDPVAVRHRVSYTIRRELPDYEVHALRGMKGYFTRIGRYDEVDRMGQRAASYRWPS
jgi:GT2 family glycosyltransferase